MSEPLPQNLDNLRDNMSRPLVLWYKRMARDLPWRKTVDPYHIWLSEMMLQQTQVATVIPYYRRFLERFPTITALADAELQDVLRLWAGLGYYRRAKNLHAAARQVVARHAGVMPAELEDLLALPGIGRYSAGAIASFAYNKRHPIVDGNVMRVLSRLLNSHADIAKPQTQKMLWHVAEELTPLKQPAAYNQAIMELGATICTPKSPQCLLCPLTKLCAAFNTGTQGLIPIKTKTASVKASQFATFVLHHGNETLLLQRPKGVTWEEMWEFPALAVPSRLNSLAKLTDVLRERLGLDVTLTDSCGRVSHQLTHRQMTYRVFRGEVRGAQHVQLPECEKGKNYHAFAWVSQIDTLPVGRITHKIADAARSAPSVRHTG